MSHKVKDDIANFRHKKSNRGCFFFILHCSWYL